MNHTLNAGRSPKNGIRTSRRGVSLIPATLGMGVMLGFASFAVDLGRVQLAKTEMRRAADAAARAGAAGFAYSPATARSLAVAWSKQNKIDARTLGDENITVTVGRWNVSSRTFKTTLTGSESYNAVRVQLKRPAAGGESVPLLWASVIGVKGCQVTGEAIAMYTPGVNVLQKVEATANPFLSGMGKGSVASVVNPHNSKDSAGDAASDDLNLRKQSPQGVPLEVQEGDVVQFDEPAEGTARHDPNLPYFDPDGEAADIGHNNVTTNHWNNYSANYFNENGIADVRAPINSLVGVFTGNDAPNRSAAPDNLNFSSEESRNFTTLKPQTKQIFFIGDGANSSGTTQSFVVPQGATKLYLATWDFYEWNNNAGHRVIKITRPARISLVK